MIKLFTHTDLDGVSCAVLAKLAFGEGMVDISYCNYDDIDAEVREFISKENNIDMCHITDIRIVDEVAKEIDNKFDIFYVLDHHPTALYLNKYPWCTVKIEDEETHIKTSGTEMYYYWLIDNGYLKRSDVLDAFVETVRDYDTWRWSTLGENGGICKQVNDLLYLYDRDKFITWCISQIHDCVFPRLYAEDELLLNARQKEIDNYVEEKNKQLYISSMCSKVCGFVFIEHAKKYASELGNRLCKMHPEIDFVAMIDMASQTVSYRAVKDNIDLGNDVAKLFGGGGHPKAAGSEFSKEVLLKTIENIFT